MTHNRWQYPDVVEPVTVPAAVGVPTWFGRQTVEAVRRKPPPIGPQPSLVVLVAAPPVTWFGGQFPDPVQQPPQPQPTEPVFVAVLAVPVVPDLVPQQLPDPVRPPAPPTQTEPANNILPIPEPPLAWGAPGEMVIRGKHHIYPAMASLVFVDELHRPFAIAWLNQLPGPVLPAKQPTHTQPDLVFEDTLLRFFGVAWLPVYPGPGRHPPVTHTQPNLTFEDALHRLFGVAWLGQLPDPTRPPRQPIHTKADLTFDDALHRPFDISWWRQGLDPVRPEARLEPGVVVRPLVEEVPATDWLRQAVEPVRAPTRLVAPQPTLLLVPSLFPVTWGWLLQHPGPGRRPLPLQLQYPPAFEPSLFPVTWGWALQGPEPLRRLRPLQVQAAAVFDPSLFPVVFDWWLPYLPDPARRAALRDSGLAALPFPVPPAVALEWFVQHAGLFRRPGLPQAPSLAMPLEVPIPFGWPPYLPEPLRRPPVPMGPQPQTPWDEGLFPLLLDKWWQQQYNPALPRPPRQWHLAEIAHDESLFPVPPLVWQTQQYNPVLPRPPRPYMLVLVVVPPPFAPTPFAFNECLALWQVMFPDTWESAAAASGLIEGLPAPATPSGYRSARWIPTPSGYVVAVEAVMPSGYISPNVMLPTPSGILTWGQICNAAAEASASGYIAALWTPTGSGYMKQPPTETERGPKSPLWDF